MASKNNGPRNPANRRIAKQRHIGSFGSTITAEAKQLYNELHNLYAPERQNVHDFAVAIDENVDLRSDLIAYHESYRQLRQEWNRRNHSVEMDARQERDAIDCAQRNGAPLPVSMWPSPLDRERMAVEHARSDALLDLSRRALLWLQYRYWHIAVDGVEMLHLPTDWFGRAVQAVIDGGGYEPKWNKVKQRYESGEFTSGWSHAIRYLDTLTIQAVNDVTHPLNLTPIRTKDDLRTYMDRWQRWDGRDAEERAYGEEQNYPARLAGLMIQWPPVYMTRDEYIDCVVKAIEDAWEHIGSTAHTRKYPGQRPDGRPRGGGARGEGYAHSVKLYNFWREHPTKSDKPELARYRTLWEGRDTITWEQFADKVALAPQFSTWYASQERQADKQSWGERGKRQHGRTGFVQQSERGRDTRATRTIEEATKKAISQCAPDPEIPDRLMNFTFHTPPPSGLLAFSFPHPS